MDRADRSHDHARRRRVGRAAAALAATAALVAVTPAVAEGHDAARGDRAATAALPHGSSLRLVLHPAEGHARRWAGWHEAGGAIHWMAGHRLRAGTAAVITWRGHVWRGADAVRGVARHLDRSFHVRLHHPEHHRADGGAAPGHHGAVDRHDPGADHPHD